MIVALNKIIAVEKGVKTTVTRRFTDLHKEVMKRQLLSGLTRTYEPKNEDGDSLPSEVNRVQVRAEDSIEKAQTELVRLFDVVATKDFGNTIARATVQVDGLVMVENAPVTYLLFLEKRLLDLKAFVEKIPTLDPSEEWSWDPNQRCYKTGIVRTQREKKVPRTITKAEATKEHPAQAEIWMDTEVVGYWNLVKYSGAISADRAKQLLDRVESLQRAVKYAREEANSTLVDDVKVGEGILTWIFAD